MKKYFLFLILVLFFSSCVTTNQNLILTSKEESWYIPKNTEFQAKKKASDELKTYKAEDDLIVLYFGYYLELEKKANQNSL